MRLRVLAENFLERLVLRLNAVPEPLFETQMAFSMARSIMAAVKLGIFEAAGDGPRTAIAIAGACQTNLGATEKLLNALVACRYFLHRNGVYTLTPKSRKWLLRRSPQNLCDKVLFQFFEWETVGTYEAFIKTGTATRDHATIEHDEYWVLYQRAMRSLAQLWATDVAARFPMPPLARDLLDIGGSHGYYAVCLCRKYPNLNAVVLDLPNAVKQAAPLLAAERMGDRVTHRAGNALTDDLGEDCVDIVFMSQLVHHFTDEQNRVLMQKIARALRPNGVCVTLDYLSPATPGAGDQAAALLDVYFGMLSESGTWSLTNMQAWLRSAGLVPQAPIRLRNMPGGSMVVGTKVRVRGQSN